MIKEYEEYKEDCKTRKVKPIPFDKFRWAKCLPHANEIIISLEKE